MVQYRCKHFTIKELVHPDLLKQLSENVLWIILDERLLRGVDKIRDLYGACTVNTSSLDGCGLVPFSYARDAKFSPHKFGRALDIHIVSIEKEAAKISDPTQRKKFKIKEYTKVRERLMLLGDFDIFNFENGVGWLHFDTYSRPNRLFNP